MQKLFFKYLILTPYFIFPVLIWFLDKSINRFILFPENILTYLMEILGIYAVSFLSLNFLLAVKSRRLERIMGGLDDQYALHKMVGRVGFALVLFHVFAGVFRSFVSSGNFNLALFVPSANPISNLGVFSFWVLTLLLILTVVIKLPYEIWKYTHKFMILPLVLAAFHGILSSYSPFLISITPIYISILLIVALVSYIYIEVIFSRFGPVYRYKVLNTKKIGNTIELFVESLNKKIPYSSGQYVFLSFIKNKRIPSETHPFAISTAPGETPQRITAKIAGDYTKKLELAQSGDIVDLIGPFGEFYFDNFKNHNRQIWIAGGIGITPYLSMLRDIKMRDEKTKIDLYYCTRNVEEAVYSEELTKIASEMPNVRLVFHCSDEKGFVNSEFIKLNSGEYLMESLIMICGPSAMMTNLKKGFQKMGVKSKNIFFENFSFK